jgi:hypothetical protein
VFGAVVAAELRRASPGYRGGGGGGVGLGRGQR